LKENSLHGKKARARATIIRLVKLVQRFWKWCSNTDDFGPHAGIPKEIAMKTPPPKKVVAPTWAEMARGIFASTGWRVHLCLLLYGTGLRVNQVMRLVWPDIDLEAAQLTVRPELGKTDAEQAGRVVPLAPWLVVELESWDCERDEEGNRTGWVVKSKRKGKRERQARDREMRAAWARAKVRPAAVTGRPHHCFRKGLGTGLKALKADDEAVEYLCGRTLPGERGTYIDGTALALVHAVSLIPDPRSFLAEPSRPAEKHLTTAKAPTELA
jgi:integrase